MRTKYDKLLKKVRESDAIGISAYLYDSSGVVIGLFTNGLLMETATKYLLTQSGETILTQAGEEILYTQTNQQLS